MRRAAYAGEIVAIVDSEDSAVHFQIESEVQILPGVGVESAVVFGDLVALEEDALRDACVLNLGLRDVERVVVEVVVDHALANAVVFGGVFVHCFLEVGVEAQHLAIVLEPLGRGLGDRVVRDLLARGHLKLGSFVEGSGCAVADGLEQLLVDFNVAELVGLWTL